MIDEFDEVLISGQASSPVQHFDKILAVVATVSPDDGAGEGDYLKVWPQDDRLVPGGKVWFPRNQVTECHLILPQEN